MVRLYQLKNLVYGFVVYAGCILIYIQVISWISSDFNMDDPPKNISYTDVNFLIMPKISHTECKGIEILYIIRSAIDDEQDRYVVRSTWGSKLNSLVFVVGVNQFGEISEKLMEESRKFEDILIMNITDTYYNLSMKSIAILKWIKEYCYSPKFFFEGDQDSAVFPEQISKYFARENSSKLSIYGWCAKNGIISRERINKLYVSRKLYASTRYPLYVAGGAIIFTSPVPHTILSVIPHSRPYFHVEDAFFSGVLAESADVPRICLNSIIGFEDIINNLGHCSQKDPILAVMNIKKSEIPTVIKKVEYLQKDCKY